MSDDRYRDRGFKHETKYITLKEFIENQLALGHAKELEPLIKLFGLEKIDGVLEGKMLRGAEK